MSLTEIKEATEKLTPTEREELARWLHEPRQLPTADDPDGEAWDRQFADDVEGRSPGLPDCRYRGQPQSRSHQAAVTHFADPAFWKRYHPLPQEIRDLADKNFALLKANAQHPSLQLKRVGRFWSVRVGIGYRAVGLDSDGDIIWFWIGPHAEYDKLLTRS